MDKSMKVGKVDVLPATLSHADTFPIYVYCGQNVREN